MRRILFVVFCIGCMTTIAFAWRKVVDLASGEFAAGFVCGILFCSLIIVGNHWFNKQTGWTD